MTDCLIGYTGFIGSNLLPNRSFNEVYNSKNIQEIRGKEFDIVYCAALSATRWIVNKNPSIDLASVNLLIDCLKTIKAKYFISMATIDVYPNPVNVDELSATSNINNHAYGGHRYMFENFILKEGNFDYALSVRLPIVFGPHFKKNVIYDLIYDNEVYKINPANILQFYDVADLYDDIQIALRNNLHIINFATEPVSVSTIAQRVFPDILLTKNTAVPFIYNMKTLYSKFYNKEIPYIYTADEIIERIATLANVLHKN